MIRSVVDRPPPFYCAKAAQWWSSISGEAYITRQLWHVSLRVDDVVAFCYCVFFYFSPFCINWCAAVMINCPYGGIHHPSTVMTDVIMGDCWCNPIKRYDDVLILGCSDVMWWWCVHDQTPSRKHKSHVSCDRSKQLLSSSFVSLDLKHFHFHSIRLDLRLKKSWYF